MQNRDAEQEALLRAEGQDGRSGTIITVAAIILMAALIAGVAGGYYFSRGERGAVALAMLLAVITPRRTGTEGFFVKALSIFYYRKTDGLRSRHLRHKCRSQGRRLAPAFP